MPPVPFTGFDEFVADFLASPNVNDAVQQSCTSSGRLEEPWTEDALMHADQLVQLQALVVLMRARAPRSVDKQWAALQRLSVAPRATEFAPVTTLLRAAFAPNAIDQALAEPPPSSGSTTVYQWWVRAAGVTHHRGALPRLVELVQTGADEVAATAASSLDDFRGVDGDDALATVTAGLRRPVAVGAARKLMARDRERARAIVVESSPQVRERYQKGLLLAELGDRRGVPILCETVPNYQIIDRTMFDAIAGLAGPEDLAAVDALPARVRGEQKARAEEVVAVVRARLGLPLPR
jgi:hypothetical protein